jgi:ribosomal protein S18 acetylase RimI-like enzyme
MNNPPVREVCQKLDWDTTFFGFGIGRIIDTQINHSQIDTVDRFAQEQAIRCLYFLCNANDSVSSEIAENYGFHLVDIRLTFAYQFPKAYIPLPSEDFIRSAKPDDTDNLVDIAKTAHQDTRFYFDKHFDRMRCNALYETWIKQSCEGQAQKVFIAVNAGVPIGYIACHLDSQNSIGTIGLVGVQAAARGNGIGSRLVQQSLNWFFEQNIQIVKVSTQARNITAQRLYQRTGFLTEGIALWYHKWY